MNKDPKLEAERLIWRFKKSGGEGVFSKPFLAFSDHIRKTILLEAQVRDSEVPAILFYFDEARWTLLTNERVVWRDEAQVSSLELTSIADATVDSSALRRAGSKATLDTLTIVESTGSRHQIHVEPGPPFSGFWNAIKAAVKA
jgi:hypothetical protein